MTLLLVSTLCLFLLDLLVLSLIQILNAMMVASQPFFNSIKVTVFRVYPSLKPHILFYSNGLDIWHCLPDIRHIQVNYDWWSAIKVGQTS